MKKWILGCTLLLMSVLSYGQTYKTVTDKAQIERAVGEIRRESSAIATLECDFTQVKTMSVLVDSIRSTGKMYYRKSDKMRWEYLSPESLCFVVNGEGVSVRRNGEVLRNEGVRMFSEISKILLGCISGEELIDETKFTVAYSMDKSHFRIELTPISRRMKMVISKICLDFGMSDYAIRSVEMWQNGDCTRIVLKNKKINEKINETVFAL